MRGPKRIKVNVMYFDLGGIQSVLSSMKGFYHHNLPVHPYSKYVYQLILLGEINLINIGHEN